MSDDIFIKHGLGTFQQPYNARQPVNAQEPNIRNTQEPNIRNAQEPNIRSQQEPNIRQARQPLTYDHRSPFTYNHRSPSTYQYRSPGITQNPYSARQPASYDHRSPSTYRHPIIYQHPSTYNHRIPYIASARQPTIKSAQEPNIRNIQQPNIRNQQEPNIRNQQEPNIRNKQSPFTYVHRSPTTYQHRSPFTYNHRSPYIANSQTPTIGTTPIIYDAIDGDTTGPSGSASGWGPSHSDQDWETSYIFRGNSDQMLQAFAQMGFAYQHTTTTPMSGNTNAGTQGDVEVSWYAGTNAQMATEYYDFIQLYDNGQTPTIDDTWAWDIKYEHQISGTNTNGTVNSYGSTYGSHTPNQSGGGGYTNGSWYAIYSGSSSAGSYNGTRNSRYFDWKAQSANYGGPNGTATVKSVGNNIWTIRITKSGQTTIYTQYTHDGVWCEVTKGSIL